MTRLAGAVVAALLLMATVDAHPVSTTTVVVALDRDGRYLVTITADAEPLIAKLEAISTDPLPAARAPAADQRAARLNALTPAFVSHVVLSFDGQRMTPTMEPARVSENGQATIRLTGVAPPNARIVTWSTSLVFGSYPLAVRSPDGREAVQWLAGQETSESVVLAAPNRVLAVGRGLWLGFTHILPNGVDHILFVLGLFLLSTRRAQWLAQVSVFTLAHSITLGLSLYGVFSLPSRIVEPLIALSVAYVGVENLLTSRLHAWRVAIVFAFGLLHGLGFAAALASLHLSRSEMAFTLVSFNAGVEGGQLAVIAIAMTTMALIVRVRVGWRPAVVTLSSGAIGLAGLIWTVQRIW